MTSNFEVFKALHHDENLFILPNAWDAKSASVFQENKFPAIATSSAAVAASLGYADGENMPFTEYLFVVKRILATVKVPLTVDMEMGYGKTKEEIMENLKKLVALGVAGINIEDSTIHNSERTLKDANEFAKTIEYLRSKLQSEKLALFINLRCDTYLLDVKDKQKETTKRLKIYESTGADGIFLPCISNEDDIAKAVDNTKLPVNVMCIPGLPGFDKLNKLGVKRVSMGPFLFNSVYKKAAELSQKIVEAGDFSPLF
ncbi:isocitrate lyase/PEP mutase family protein [Terrimonas pollutisoli]|uniref:isocitrate lyase/PEP mutase family protein n=1 Tax=Terrimonas pollutisoli TaxID=3034147 RepID=UPI0023EB8A93|nr:isocitrate lyase/phosphoenolpyruvate mutase family protein [Terrimonas sp. H1YJ31]